MDDPVMVCLEQPPVCFPVPLKIALFVGGALIAYYLIDAIVTGLQVPDDETASGHQIDG